MKYKLAITYGVISWILIYILTTLFNSYITIDIPYENMINPLLIIIITGIFGILYIRNFNSNEVLEGIKIGIIFFSIDLLCDCICFIILNQQNTDINNYIIHLISMIILIPAITTFIGYLAQMTIELR